jgi:hypothetical protein
MIFTNPVIKNESREIIRKKGSIDPATLPSNNSKIREVSANLFQLKPQKIV